jgi:hypothetical protein
LDVGKVTVRVVHKIAAQENPKESFAILASRLTK